MRNPFRRKKDRDQEESVGTVVSPEENPEFGETAVLRRVATSGPDRQSAGDYDPLNPHGDGTLRPGDPIFEAAMRGNSVVGTLNEDGTWDYKEFPAQ